MRGGMDEAMPECARSRAQQLASFKPRNISQPPAHPALLRPGRPHSANAEIQLRSPVLNDLKNNVDRFGLVY